MIYSTALDDGSAAPSHRMQSAVAPLTTTSEARVEPYQCERSGVIVYFTQQLISISQNNVVTVSANTYDNTPPFRGPSRRLVCRYVQVGAK